MEAMLFCFRYKKLIGAASLPSVPAKKDLLFIQTNSEGGSIETEIIDETVIANKFTSS